MPISSRFPRIGRALVITTLAAAIASVVVPTASATSPDCTVRGAGVDLSGCDLTGVDLTGANLAGADLRGATIAASTVLTGANLAGADLTGGFALSASFSGVNLTGANFKQVRLNTSTSFVGATMTGIMASNLRNPAAPILPAGWTFNSQALIGPTADLRNGIAVGVFAGIDFTGVTMAGAPMVSNNFTGATGLADVDLTGALLDNNNLGSIDLRNATIAGLRSIDNYGTPLLPTGSALRGGFVIGPDVNLDGTDLSTLNLSGLDLTEATLIGANLTSADFAGTNLTDADLTDATVTGIDLSTAELDGVISSGLVGTPAALPANWSLVAGVLTYTAPVAPTPEPTPTPAPTPTPTPSPVVAPVEPVAYTPAPGITVGESRGEVALVPATPAAGTDLLRGANIWVRPSSTTEILPGSLPAGVKLVNGKLVAEKPGTYTIKVKVKRKNGTTVTRKIKVKVG